MSSVMKSSKVDMSSGHREPKSPTRKVPGELVRRPSGSSLKNSHPDRKVSVATSARKVSVTSCASSGRKISTTKGRNPPGALTRKTSNCSDRFSNHSIQQAGLFQRPLAASSSIVGFRQLLVTKRLARNLKLRTTQRIAERRGRSFITYSDRPRNKQLSSHQHQAAIVEPTYQVGPEQKFGEFGGMIKDMLEDMIPQRLAKIPYDAGMCSGQAKSLAGDIQEKVKELRIDRYKLITMVHIGEIQQQTIRVCSRGIWDVAVDSYITYQYQNATLYCVATVFGIYHE